MFCDCSFVLLTYVQHVRLVAVQLRLDDIQPPRMSKTNKNNNLEIILISAEKDLDEDKLKFFFKSHGCSNIKKCKVLKGCSKAYITFNDFKSYNAALDLAPGTTFDITK